MMWYHHHKFFATGVDFDDDGIDKKLVREGGDWWVLQFLWFLWYLQFFVYFVSTDFKKNMWNFFGLYLS